MALVLIVVDEPSTLLALRRDLESSGHHAVLAADADTALERLAALPIDVVVLDVMMPVRDGWTVLESLRDRPRRLPTFVLSGRAGPGNVLRARRLGAVGVLHRAASAEELRQAVASALTMGGAVEGPHPDRR